MKEKALNTLRVAILSLILSTAIGYSFANWVAPSGPPPFNNVPPPINVGAASQIRDGNLFLNNWLIAKKAQTQSTVASDNGTTLTTKDYVDSKSKGSSWVDVTASRSIATPYTNDTGHPIEIAISTDSTSRTRCVVNITVDSTPVLYSYINGNTSGQRCSGTVTVPAGSTYILSVDGWSEIYVTHWAELR